MKTNYLPIWAAGLLLASSLLSSCKKELEQTTPAGPAPTAVSDSTGVIKHGKLDGHPIRYREINGEAVWQGDILLTPEQLGQRTDPNARTSGAGRSYTFYRWPDAVIPYEIAPDMSQTVIKQAIAHWEANTSIAFVPRTSQADYVRFVSSGVNQSSVGKQGEYMEILKSLQVGGSFHYAPDLPFVESYLDDTQYQIKKYAIGKLDFKTTVVKRLK